MMQSYVLAGYATLTWAWLVVDRVSGQERRCQAARKGRQTVTYVARLGPMDRFPHPWRCSFRGYIGEAEERRGVYEGASKAVHQRPWAGCGSSSTTTNLLLLPLHRDLSPSLAFHSAWPPRASVRLDCRPDRAVRV